MPDSNQDADESHQQTDFHGSSSGIFHTGSGAMHINLPAGSGVSEAIALIRRLVPGEQMYVVDKIVDALLELRRYQKKVAELKSVHNMLHRLETVLAMFESPIRFAIMQQQTLDLFMIEDTWRIAVRPQIWEIQCFATDKIEFLGEPRLVITKTDIIGPLWAKDLIILQESFEKNLEEKNTKAIYDTSRNLLDTCRNQLFLIDRHLLEAIDELNQISDLILRSMSDGKTKHPS
jgi:hypothetical protein